MKHAHFVLGLTMLCVAGTVAAFLAVDPPAPAGKSAGRSASSRAPALPPAPPAAHPASPKSPSVRMAVLLGAVEAPDRDPLRIEQAALVEAAAHRRLAELTTQLGLNRKQQAQVFPLLARSSPHYDESLRITGRSGLGLATPIDRREAEREIYDLLDGDQQAELDLAAAEKDLWWSSVISRLERDLRNSTRPGPESSSPPAPGVAPRGSAPPPAAAPPAPRRRESLFER